MKKFFALALGLSMGMASVVSADQVIQDFESGTDAAAITGAWNAGFSGTSAAAIVASSDDAVYSAAQDNTSGSGLSALLTWTWSGAAGRVRIQPTAGVEAGPTDHTAEPFVSWAIFGNNTGDSFSIYMCDSGNNAGYEEFTDNVVINFTGWQQFSWNITSSPVVAWITGDGTLSTTCEWCGMFFFNPDNSTEAVEVYLDDLQYTAALVGTLADASTTDVSDWSTFK